MKFILTLVFCLLFCSPLLAQQTVAEKKIYTNIQIENFTIKDGVELPAENSEKITQRLVKSFQKSKRFGQVSANTETTDTAKGTSAAEEPATDVPTLKVSGEIILYKKGNQGGRYLLGPFGGQKFATRMVAIVKFVDVKTGETVLEETVDGVVAGGFFGGDEDDAKGGLTSEIVKIAKKNFTAKGK